MENFEEIIKSLIEDIYLTYDVNRDGFLQKDECQQFMKATVASMGNQFDQKNFEKMFKKYDVNGDGKIC